MRTVLSLLLLVAVVGIGFWAGRETAAPPDADRGHSLAFNHKVHVEQGLECGECHKAVASQQGASMPGLAECESCHDASPDKNPELTKLAALLEKRTAPTWNPATRLENGTVFFSHGRHVTTAKLPCEACHGEMKDRTAPPAESTISLTMDLCINCHAEHGAKSDCLTCHR